MLLAAFMFAAQADTALVRNLAPLADMFVNDAFAAAHRCQPSLVGFIEAVQPRRAAGGDVDVDAMVRVAAAVRPDDVWSAGSRWRWRYRWR